MESEALDRCIGRNKKAWLYGEKTLNTLILDFEKDGAEALHACFNNR